MSTIPLDYQTLRILWWALLGILLIGFAVMGGRDLGVGTLLPFVAKTDEERRVLINLVGPTWEGNQVWLILGGGAIFAAWPQLYAVSFSGFYIAMIAILLALIIRPVGFKFRGKVSDPRWRATWDTALFIGGFLPALIFGVAVGNVFLGAPFQLDVTQRITYSGNFFGLLTPFALLCGLVSLSMIVTQGAAVIAGRTDGEIAERARKYGRWSALATIVLFVIGGLLVLYVLEGYRLIGPPRTIAPSNPLGKEVVREVGAWGGNYGAMPWTMALPILALFGSIVAWWALGARARLVALLGSSLAIFGIIATAGLSLFPFLLPSSIDPQSSLTVWDASSSQLTLFVMLCAAIVFLPIIILYTSWVFRVMRGPVTTASLNKNPNAY
ncbi:cytochrome d ubiquinol oxidase subunit II [Devosia insulae DS-56]|uniref:Cytochrome d ubiquinol oxidase subunit II n=1 Tax=Devosia insulae DS-56 TaxID=1116389 RepID=A0A1E5XR79_9HYPH|nr:cytochrome d ubiquinol oxidase subunit II [Devosia insulae]OEO31111.1 cytochrome d ubiquinol oxidase subunit II [Devosia insulae DS-56]